MESGGRRNFNRRDLIVGGAASLTALSARPAFAAEKPVGVWTRLKDMPLAVQEIYPTAFWRTDPSASLKPKPTGVLVNAGGLTNAPGSAHNVSDRVTIFDPLADAWSEGPRLPEPRHHVALVQHNGFLYAIGGFRRDERGGWQMRTNLWRVESLAALQWTALTSLPIPQAETVAASVGGCLHVVGGRAPAGSRNREWTDHIDADLHWAYDSGADRWEPRRPIPSPRNSAAGAIAGGLLFVIGGRTVGDGNSAVTEVYEPVSDRWQKLSPMPAPLRQSAPRGQGGLAAAVWQGKIYAMGGEWFGATSGVYADVWEFDPREDKWRAVAAMPRPRHGLGAVALADGIYVCGGAAGPSDEGVSATLDRFAI